MEPRDLARYFIAILPPSPIFEEVLALKNYFKEKYNSKASLNSPPHMTIHAPFFWAEPRESELVDSLKIFATRTKPIEVSLSDFGAFVPRVIFISVERSEELTELYKNLTEFCDNELSLMKDQPQKNKFHPHLTIAFRDLQRKHFDRAWQEFKERRFSASFRADAFDLLKHDGRIWQPLHHFNF